MSFANLTPLSSHHPVGTAFIPKKFRLIFKLVIASNLLNLIICSGGFWYLQPQIPLFYSLAQPEQQLVPKIWIFLLPGFSLIINLNHLLLLKILKPSQLFVSQLFSYSTLILQIILLMIASRLILILT